MRVDKHLPRFVELWLVTFDESDVFIVILVIIVQKLDPRRQLVLSIQVLI